MFVFLELGAKFVGADGGREAVGANTHVFIAKTERGCSTGSRAGDLVVTIAPMSLR